MKTIFTILVLSLSCSSQTKISGNVKVSGNVSFNVPGVVAPTAIQMSSLPSNVTTLGAICNALLDGYLYCTTQTGTTPSIVVSVYRTLQTSTSGPWDDITGSNFPGTGSRGAYMGMMPDGTPLLVISTSASVYQVWYWNKSVGSPVWTQITGWTTTNNNQLNSFANDPVTGLTCFSPSGAHSIWCNATPNGKAFSQSVSEFFSYTGNGTGSGLACQAGVTPLIGPPDSGCTGNTYQFVLVNPGSGYRYGVCGEGGFSELTYNLATFVNFTTYSSTPSLSYTSNCTGLAASTTTVGVIRGWGSNVNQNLTSINLATGTPTQYASATPRTSTGFPGTLDTNNLNILSWVNGNIWLFHGRNTGATVNYALLSTDNLATWADLTTTTAIDATCQGSNLSAGSTAGTSYVFVRCQSGKVWWRYGPL